MHAKPTPLDPETLTRRLESLPGWTCADGWLQREYATDGWRSTMLLVNAIAFLAEAADHHPDLGVHWGRVEVRLQSHDAGGVTDRDIALATRIDALINDQPIGWVTS
ncbi:MAG: 4a-hydroxytetrahydrobiopterin dehydratase [Gemmatimonadota bacterium]